ncbi:MAG: outer membrane protein assembly factor BamE [Alphaproteobacteria bacterium]|nr:outer membrane protein assembly factor BamE [Alphaproteobacteria bacterium]
MKKILFAIFLAMAPLLTACTTGTDPVADEQMTVAKAQREIKVGMSSAQVVEVLGSPNMITTDDKRRETWVYDRVSSNVSQSSSGVWLLVAGASNAKQSSTQRTLTIIVKFDENNKVRDFAYRTSVF